MNKTDLLAKKDSKKSKVTKIQNVTATLSNNILHIYIYTNKVLEKSIFLKPQNRLIYNHKAKSWSESKITDIISFINLEDTSKTVIDNYLKKFDLTDSKYNKPLPYAELLNKLSSKSFQSNTIDDKILVENERIKSDWDKIQEQVHNALPAKILTINQTKCFCTKCRADFTKRLKARSTTTCPNCGSEATVVPIKPYVNNAWKYNDGTVKTYFTNKSKRQMIVHTLIKHINEADKILFEIPAYPIYNVAYKDLDTKPLSECITEQIVKYVDKIIVFKRHHVSNIYQPEYGGIRKRTSNYTVIPHNPMTYTSSFTDIYTTYDIENKGNLKKLQNYNTTQYDESENLIFEMDMLDVNMSDLDHIKNISHDLYDVLNESMQANNSDTFHSLYKYINMNSANIKTMLNLNHMKANQLKKIISSNTKDKGLKLSAIIKLILQGRLNAEFVDQIDIVMKNLPTRNYRHHTTYNTIYESNKDYEKRIRNTLLALHDKFIIKANGKTLNVLESLSKLKKKDLVSEMIQKPDIIKLHKSTELTKALGITKKQLADINNLSDLAWSVFNYNDKLKHKESTINEVKNYIKTPDESFAELLDATKMSLLQFANYIPVLIKNYISFNTYKKYIDTCIELQKQVTSNTINRPKDIQFAIKQAQTDLNLFNNPVLKEMRQKANETELKQTFEDLKLYEYTNGKYSIVVPNQPEDIVKEGIALNHCVAKTTTFLERMYEHESYILFLRKIDEVTKPWYTLEIEPGGVIRQKRTEFDNINSDFNDTLPFLNEWQNRIRDLTKNLADEIENSKNKRIKNLMTLRSEQKTVIIDGKVHLLADVLEQDLLQI